MRIEGSFKVYTRRWDHDEHTSSVSLLERCQHISKVALLSYKNTVKKLLVYPAKPK